MAISEEKPKLQKGFIHSSFFPLYLFSPMSPGTILLSSMEIAVRHISFGQVHTKASRDQAIFWRLRITENLDDSGHEMSLFTISNSLDNCLSKHKCYVYGLNKNTFRCYRSQIILLTFTVMELKSFWKTFYPSPGVCLIALSEPNT